MSRTATLVTVLLVAMTAVAPASMAQPAGAGPPSEGPGGTGDAEGERGLERAIEVVPSFVADLLRNLLGWFTPG